MVPGTEQQSESDTPRGIQTMDVTHSISCKQVVSLSACVDDYSSNNVRGIDRFSSVAFGHMELSINQNFSMRLFCFI